MKKLCLQDCIDVAKERGGECLSDKYVNIDKFMKWECDKCKKIWKTTFKKIKSGAWCPKCKKTKIDCERKVLLDGCVDIAKNRNGKCLSNKYINNSTKLHWECEEGHQWTARPKDIKKGKWCPTCGIEKRSAKKRLSVEECHLIAKKNGGKCLSNKYINNRTKIKWQCKNGHIWEARFGHIKDRNCWCPECAILNKKKPKLSLKDCKIQAKKMGGRCLSDNYINYKSKMKWKCNCCENIWETAFMNIRSGSWCPKCGIKKCADKRRLSLEDCKNVAKDRGGKCLSKEYMGSEIKLQWQCESGHIWSALIGNVKSGGTWCPQCSLAASRTQQKIYNIAKGIFLNNNVYNNYNDFDWLKTESGGKQEIDIYVKDIGLAIEYDGIQHFEPIKYFGGKRGLKNVQRLDKLKNEKIESRPEDVKYFVRFNYKEKEKISKAYIIEKLKKAGLEIKEEDNGETN